MRVLAEVTEATIGLPDPVRDGVSYRLRTSARAILLDEEGLLAVQYVAANEFHKLPGGGVDEGETVAAACCREVREEVGCACILERSLGVVIEYRAQHELLQISYGFVARVEGKVQAPQYEAEEVALGQRTVWYPPEVARARVAADKPTSYAGHFMSAREQVFLRAFL